MPRQASGQLIVRKGVRDTTFGARVRVGDSRRFVVLGYASDGMTEATARVALTDLSSDIRRGIWRAPDPAPLAEEPKTDPDFHTFSSAWFDRRQYEVGDRTAEHWRWALSLHLLPHFKNFRVSQLTVEAVDTWKAAKVREREEKLVEKPLSNGSINKCLKVLGCATRRSNTATILARTRREGGS